MDYKIVIKQANEMKFEKITLNRAWKGAEVCYLHHTYFPL